MPPRCVDGKYFTPHLGIFIIIFLFPYKYHHTQDWCLQSFLFPVGNTFINHSLDFHKSFSTGTLCSTGYQNPVTANYGM